MRLVILTADGLEHRYVANVLSRAFPDEVRAIVVAQPARRSFLGHVRVWSRRYTGRQLASRICARAYALLLGRSRRRRATYARYLSPGGPLDWDRGDLVRRVPSANGDQCRALLQHLAPDVIAVYGTAVIKAPVIRLAGRALLNMHTGLSPHARRRAPGTQAAARWPATAVCGGPQLIRLLAQMLRWSGMLLYWLHLHPLVIWLARRRTRILLYHACEPTESDFIRDLESNTS